MDAQLNLSKLYRLYLEKCVEERRRPASRKVYIKVFKTMNRSFHVPKKDQCPVCTRWNFLLPAEKEGEKANYDAHLLRAKRARELKNEIKEKINQCEEDFESAKLYNVDLQKVLETPKSEAGPIFYKRKLAIYNLTVYDLNSREGICNLWDQTYGKRGSNETCTLLFNLMKTNGDVRKFYFVTDCCGGQFRNQFMVAMYVFSIMTLPNVQEINHIFLESGHTQQEGDTMHACIERAAKNVPVFTIEGWRTICLLARINPFPYIVNVIDDHKYWSDFHQLGEDLIKNKKKSTDRTTVLWNKIKYIRVCKDAPSLVYFKYDFESNFKSFDIRMGSGNASESELQLKKAYPKRLPLAAAKYKDLQDLCKSLVIPRIHHDLYKNLPYSKVVRDALEEPDVEDVDQQVVDDEAEY